ncbi:MAG: hypothetical protein E7242_02610 [Lachnospiraceae bacterium]|nr:hypothetical protein [Lachnospiraceae bacterium]
MVKSKLLKVLVATFAATMILGTSTVAFAADNSQGKDSFATFFESQKETENGMYEAYTDMLSSASLITKVYEINPNSSYGYGKESSGTAYWKKGDKLMNLFLKNQFGNKDNYANSGLTNLDKGLESSYSSKCAYGNFWAVSYTENGANVVRFFNYHIADSLGNIYIVEKTAHFNEGVNEADAYASESAFRSAFNHWTEEVYMIASEVVEEVNSNDNVIVNNDDIVVTTDNNEDVLVTTDNNEDVLVNTDNNDDVITSNDNTANNDVVSNIDNQDATINANIASVTAPVANDVQTVFAANNNTVAANAQAAAPAVEKVADEKTPLASAQAIESVGDEAVPQAQADNHHFSWLWLIILVIAAACYTAYRIYKKNKVSEENM